ncbi:MAG: hypothetical protein A3H91_15490 [Gammaproteobacteria bacterium RIFCSPLOWO2_02_FULL_61_13]|nr:MAG: hypothetical protein A3H91_15490 [Gammaproteobacteria bacterium RIFCSPLOWO2_02_FULL_61_13]
METQTLRDLAKDYAKGTLDRESYRRNRATLIDGILAGTIRVEAIDFAAPVVARVSQDNTSPGKRKRNAETNAVELDELDVFDITQVVPASGDVTPPRPQRAPANGPAPAAHNTHSNLPLVIVGIIAIVAVLGLVVALVSRKDNGPAAAAQPPTVNADTMVADTPESVASVAASNGANAATDALVEFLDVKDWSDQSLDQFQARWLALPQSDRDAAAGSGELLQVANAAHRKLLEIRALSHVSDAATTSQKEEKLLAFVSSLGIADSRLTPQAANNTATSD